MIQRGDGNLHPDDFATREAGEQKTVYFEDLDTGRYWRQGPARLTAEGIVDFARQWDPQSFHVDEEAAARSAFGGLVASGAHTFALATRLFTTPTGIAFMAARGFERVRLLRPLRPDVDVYLEIRVLRLKGGPGEDSGQADFSLRLIDASGQPILLGTVDTLVWRRPTGG